MMKRGDYALELSTPIRHVATMIGDALGSVSIQEMAATYKGLQNGDLHRIKLNEELGSDAEAVEWLMEYAVERIMKTGKKGMGKDQIVKDDNGYRLADGMTADGLTYEGKVICGEEYDKHKLLRDPFNPLSGIFSENIRVKGKDDLTELVESIEALGYVPDTGIVKDERGVVISGHRRLAALEKAGVDPAPYITPKIFGDGDEADMERLKYAIATNTGQKGLSPADRKRIAVHLYGTGEWSMVKIGELLKVNQRTISEDLADVTKFTKRDSLGRLSAPAKAHDDIKPLAIEDLKSGLSVRKTAEKYGVSIGYVMGWQRSVRKNSVAIPEDQQQAFFKLVLDEGRLKTAAYTEVSGKQPTKNRHIPDTWNDALNKEIGRREAQFLAPNASVLPALDAETATLLDWVDANRDSDVTGLDASTPTEQPYSKQCVCPHCGATHERGR